nr:hypothetical protein [Succinivibrionaceae bacterium]
ATGPELGAAQRKEALRGIALAVGDYDIDTLGVLVDTLRGYALPEDLQEWLPRMAKAVEGTDWEAMSGLIKEVGQ